MIPNDELLDDVLVYAPANVENDCITLVSTQFKQGGLQVTDVYDEFAIDIYLLSDDPSSSIVAIDWDNTFTLMPELLLVLIQLLRQHGYHPLICTLREDTQANQSEFKRLLGDANIDIHCTNGQAKQAFFSARGESVNLWIDDYFPSICKFNSRLIKKNHIYGIDLSS